MKELKITRGKYPGLFGGIGFHNNDAMLYPIMDEDYFWQKVCKCYREITPGFMRTFMGYYNQTEESLDKFAEYYEYMQKWTDTPMYLTVDTCHLHFTDEEIQDYCENIANRLAYLYHKKGVKHIRYYCLSNELTRKRHGNLVKDMPTFKKYHEYFYRAFLKRNLPIGLLSTDATEYENWNTVDWALKNMNEITDDVCVHIYHREHMPEDPAFYDFFYGKCADIVDLSIQSLKRVILGECGLQMLPTEDVDKVSAVQMSYGKGVIIDTCRYYEMDEYKAYMGLMLTEMCFAAINAGVYALAFWTFVDCPDPYSCGYSTKEGFSKKWGENERFFSATTRVKFNKWGVIKWDNEGKYEVRPHFYALAPLTKFFGRNTRLLDVSSPDPMLRMCAVSARFGEGTTVGIVNRHKEATEIRLDTDLFGKSIRVYEFDPKNVAENKFGDMQSYVAVIPNDNPVYVLKPESVTYFTTDYIEKTESVEAKNVTFENGRLSWDASTDANHCYWRVYASDKKGFEPSYENQIASTAAESLFVVEEKRFYRVLSVDISGNV